MASTTETALNNELNETNNEADNETNTEANYKTNNEADNGTNAEENNETNNEVNNECNEVNYETCKRLYTDGSIAYLNFVENQQKPILVTKLAKFNQKFGQTRPNTTLALYRFHQNSNSFIINELKNIRFPSIIFQVKGKFFYFSDGCLRGYCSFKVKFK